AAGRRSVDRLRQRAEADPFLVQVADDLDQMGEAASEAIELPRHQHIARREHGQRPVEGGAVSSSAVKAFVLKNLLATGERKCIEMQRQVLVFRRYARVTDQHAFQVASRSRARKTARSSQYQMGSLLMARVTNPCDAQHHQDTDFTIRMAAFPPLRQKG